jgi:hypothetical protein
MAMADRESKLSGKSSLLSFAVAAFQAKGGEARFCDVYPEFRRLLRQHHHSIEKPDETLRHCVHMYCPERKGFAGDPVFRATARGYRVDLSKIHFSDESLPDIFAEQ